MMSGVLLVFLLATTINGLDLGVYNVRTGDSEGDAPLCFEGTRQSPIDISDCVNVKMDHHLAWKGYSNRPDGFKMINTGTTAQIHFKGDKPALIKGGPLCGNYTLDHLHFHYGDNNVNGSDHSFNGEYQAAESHFVHYKTEYGSLTEALRYSDGLAVIAVLFKLSDEDNADLAPVINHLQNVTTATSIVELPSDALPWVPEVFSHKHYVTYSGSLTFTPCNEVVTWLVMKQRPTISADQLAEFRTLQDENGDPIESYRRNVQRLAGRTVICPKC